MEKQDQLAPEKLREFLLKLYTTAPLVRGTEFRSKLPRSWPDWAKLSDKELGSRLQTLGEQRRKLLDAKTDLEMEGKALTETDKRRLTDTEFESDLGSLEQILREYEKRSWEKRPKAQQAQDRLKQFRLVAYSAQIVLVAVRNQRFAEVGTRWPALPPSPLPNDCGPSEMDLLTANVDEAQEAAVRTALTNRMDLMNTRAQVVDAWRQLCVTANALLGVLNPQFTMDSITPPTGSNPLAFSKSQTNAELSLNAQLPLVRITQRNVYRAALINYQRARRNLINLEDGIAAQVRFDVRQLHLFAENYKIQQKVIQSLYSQVESALEVIVAPADPDSLKTTGTAGNANAAALTSQYLGVLGQLNGAQTKMYDYWLSIEATRIQLYSDLDRLILDSRGVWTDEPGKSNPGQSAPDQQRGPTQPGNAVGISGGGLRSTDFGGPHDGPGPDAAGESIPRPRFLAPAAAAPLE